MPCVYLVIVLVEVVSIVCHLCYVIILLFTGLKCNLVYF